MAFSFRGRQPYLLLSAALLLMSACGSDSTTPPPGPPPAITLAASGTSHMIRRGGVVDIPLTVTRLHAYAGEVTLALMAQAEGMTGAMTPSMLSPTQSTATLRLAASAATPLGATSVTVKAAGIGVADQVITVPLQVAEAPGVTLDVGSGAVTLTQGATASRPITITRVGGYAGAVQLSLTTGSAGEASSFAPNPTTGGASTLALTADLTATVGTHTYQIRAEGPDMTPVSAPLTVTVVEPPGFRIALPTPSVSVP